MKKRYLIGMFIFLALNVWGILRFSATPEPGKMIDPSYFDKPEEAGVAVYRRLYDPLTREDLVVVGVPGDEPQHRAIAEGFLAAAALEQHPIAVVFKEQELEPLKVPPGTEVIDVHFNSDSQALVQLIKDKLAGGKKGLLYTANVFSSHILKQNPMSRFELAWGKPVFAISTISIGIRMEQDFKVNPNCVGSEKDGLGTAALGCAALLQERTLYRKKLPADRIVMLMDQRGPTDYLVFSYFPKK